MTKRALSPYINSITLMATVVALSAVAAVVIPARGKAETSAQYVASRCTPTAIIGHRGTTEGGVRANTLPALKKAVAGGASGLEIDIRVTKSVAATKKTKAQPAIWIVNHDATITRTVSGKNVTKTISTSTYAELKKLAPDLMSYSQAISYAKSVNKGLEVEIKSSSVSAARLQGLSDVLRNTGMQNKVTYTSFNANTLKAYRAVKNRAGRTGFITNTALPASTASLNTYAASVRKYADVIILRYAIATPGNITILKNNKLLVEVYTTDSARPTIDGSATWAKYIGYGVNGIITDKAATYSSWCKNIQPKPPIFIPPTPPAAPEPVPEVPTPDPTPEPTPDPVPEVPVPEVPTPEVPEIPEPAPEVPTPTDPLDPPVTTDPPSVD